MVAKEKPLALTSLTDVNELTMQNKKIMLVTLNKAAITEPIKAIFESNFLIKIGY